MPGVASFLFLLFDEFTYLDLKKVLYPSEAAEVFSLTFVIVLELLRSELLVLIELCLIHDLSVRMGEKRTRLDAPKRSEMHPCLC